MANHGTATPTQFVRFNNPLVIATASAAADFDIKQLIDATDGNVEALTETMKIVLTALTTKQKLILQPADKPVAPKLLELVSAAQVVAMEKFSAADNFKLGEKNGVKISYLGDNFKSKFLKMIEENVTAAEIKTHKLLKSSRDPQIITELGDENREIQLGQFWQLLKAQGEGQAGTLLTNGYANIAYISDVDGILWAVHAYWDGDGWRVDALSVGDPDEWLDGCQVLSR